MKGLTLKKIDIMSLAKFYMYMLGIIYSVIGIIAGIITIATGNIWQGILIIIFAIIIGFLFGFIIGVIAVFIANIFLNITGGIKFYFNEENQQ